jgi:hypothetical protein
MILIHRLNPSKHLRRAGGDLLSDMKTWTDSLDKSAWYYLAVQEATNSNNFQTEASEQWTALTQDPDWTQYQN